MKRNYCNLVKFVSCIFVFISHNTSSIFLSFGSVACVFFFFLSAYGIVKSLYHCPRGALCVLFTKANIKSSNTLCTILLVSALLGKCVIPYVGRAGTDSLVLLVNETGWSSIIQYTVGICKIDNVAWFIDVLIFLFSHIFLLYSP